jgi:hypothetical protein
MVSAYYRATQLVSHVYQAPESQPVKSYVTTYATTADIYANKALDKIQARFPYPFESSPETIYADLQRAPEMSRTRSLIDVSRHPLMDSPKV